MEKFAIRSKEVDVDGKYATCKGKIKFNVLTQLYFGYKIYTDGKRTQVVLPDIQDPDFENYCKYALKIDFKKYIDFKYHIGNFKSFLEMEKIDKVFHIHVRRAFNTLGIYKLPNNKMHDYKLYHGIKHNPYHYAEISPNIASYIHYNYGTGPVDEIVKLQHGYLYYKLRDMIKKGDIYTTMDDKTKYSVNFEDTKDANYDHCAYNLFISDNKLYRYDELNKEFNIGNILKRKENYTFNNKINNKKLSDQQQNAVISIMKNRISTLTGGAGTGKSTVILELVKQFISNSENYIILAITGQAISVLLSNDNKLQAKTCASFLCGYYRSDMVEINNIIFEESSMLDNDNLFYILNKISKPKRIVFVGDCNQLAPPGTIGHPFRYIEHNDIINHCNLTTNFRNANCIGYGDILSALLKKELINDDRYMEFIGNDERDVINQYSDICNDKMKSIIILTPGKECKEISKTIHERRKPSSGVVTLVNEKIEKIYIGLQLRCIKNIYIDNELYFANGNTGIIKDIIKDENGKAKDIVISNNVLGFKLTISLSSNGNYSIDNFTLAWTCSIYKAQGSEYDIVILFLPETYQFMYNINFIYTALSRAKEKAYIACDKNKFMEYIKRDGNPINSTLGDMINLKNIT